MYTHFDFNIFFSTCIDLFVILLVCSWFLIYVLFIFVFFFMHNFVSGGVPIRFCFLTFFSTFSTNYIDAAGVHRLSTKSLLNLATKTVPGHVLKHGYVLFLFIINILSAR